MGVDPADPNGDRTAISHIGPSEANTYRGRYHAPLKPYRAAIVHRKLERLMAHLRATPMSDMAARVRIERRMAEARRKLGITN